MSNIMYTNPFLFLCVFWGISPRQSTLGHYARLSPPILYVPMIPWKFIFLWNTKEVRKQEGSCLHKGFRTRAFSWRLGTSKSSRPWVPLPQENTLGHEPLLQQNHLDNIMTQALGESDKFLGMLTVVNIDDYTKLRFNVEWGKIDFEKLLI